MLVGLGAHADPVRAAKEIKVLRPEAQADEALKEGIRQARRICAGIPSVDSLLNSFHSGKLKLARGAMDVLNALAMARYVLGDGLDGYLDSMGHLWPRARAGLELVGQRKAAKAFVAAANIAFGQRVPKSSKEATAAMSSLSDREEADLQTACDFFWSLIDGVIPAIERRISAHPNEFRRAAEGEREGQGWRGRQS
jgi:hypothetical protein